MVLRRSVGLVKKITAFILRFVAFFGEVSAELKKSAWPAPSELVDSTIVVILSVVVLGVFVGFSDLVLMRILKLIL